MLLESDHRLPPKFLYTTRMQLGNLLWYSDRARLANPNTEASLSDSGRNFGISVEKKKLETEQNETKRMKENQRV